MVGPWRGGWIVGTKPGKVNASGYYGGRYATTAREVAG
jgi:hypothetical protein